MITPILADIVDYAPIGIFVLIAVLFGIINIGLPHVAGFFLGHYRTGRVKETTYESGMNPIHTARRRFNIRFYILAMTFLVFDVEIVFLFPWAPAFRNLDPSQADLSFQFLARVVFFIATSVIAYVYAWRKGVFRFD